MNIMATDEPADQTGKFGTLQIRHIYKNKSETLRTNSEACLHRFYISISLVSLEKKLQIFKTV